MGYVTFMNILMLKYLAMWLNNHSVAVKKSPLSPLLLHRQDESGLEAVNPVIA